MQGVQERQSELERSLYKHSDNIDMEIFARNFIEYCKSVVDGYNFKAAGNSIERLVQTIDDYAESLARMVPHNIKVGSVLTRFMKTIRSMVTRRPEPADPFEQADRFAPGAGKRYISLGEFNERRKRIEWGLQEMLDALSSDRVSYYEFYGSIVNGSDVVFLAGFSRLAISFFQGAAGQRIYVPECYPYRLGSQMVGLAQGKPYEMQLVHDNSCCIFIERCRFLLFEPIVVLRNGSCVVDSPVLSFIMVAQFYKKPVYAIVHSLQFSEWEPNLNFQHPNMLF